MVGEGTAAVASLLRWWSDAGVTDAVGDEPFDWLAGETNRIAPEPAVAAPSRVLQRPVDVPAAPIVEAAPPPELADLAAFDAWLAADEGVPGREWSDRLVMPEGPADAPLMLLADVPDPADLAEGRLFAGAQGALIAAMLAAIGLSRAICRIGSIACTRPIAGKIGGAPRAALTALAHRHVALARPRALLLLGPQAAQIMTGEGLEAGARQRVLNQDGARVATYAIHHPRLLLERPLLKRGAWEGLKLVREHIAG